MVSVPSRFELLVNESIEILSPEVALKTFPARDVVIASYASAQAMSNRLMNIDAGSRSRIWFLQECSRPFSIGIQ
jgi:hypothetical protein